VVSAVFIIFPKNSFSTDTIGLYESLETLITIQDNSYSKKMKKFRNKISNLTNLKDPMTVELDPDFINNILFHSPSRYSSLAHKDRCSLYDLILSGHIRDEDGDLRRFLIKYETRKGKIKTTLVSRTTFLNQVAFKQCPQSKNFERYFQVKNLKKTLKTIKLEVPTSYDQCYKVYNEFVSDYKTPYLCKIYEQIKKAPALNIAIKNTPKSKYNELTKLKKSLSLSKDYKKVLNIKSYDYLKNLCDNIEKPKKFCHDFFELSFWKKIIKGEKSSIYIKNMCQEIYKRKKITPRQFQKCARILNTDPQKCHYLNRLDSALSPKPSCKNISKALNLSRLISNYNDCPSKTGNEGISNIARVINHISPQKKFSNNSCQLESTKAFAKFSNEVNEGRDWNVKLCYDDKINNKEICLPTLLGEYPGSDLSLDLVVAKILRKTRGFGNEQKCRVVSKKEYRPTLLEFKGGCYVIVSDKSCRGTNCKFKIINDELEVKHIRYKSDISFAYFPVEYTKQNNSQFNLMQKHFKKKSRKILNISFVKSIFKEKPKAILQGIGCREDLLPTFFQKTSLNQCSPLPFIVDGYIEDRGTLSLIVRTALDSLHAPRIISWSYVYSSLKAYKDLHPMNLWGLYAIY
jgi:hypothetical protein